MADWSSPAAWYDVLNPWGPSDDFYLGLVMSARRVLDVGCGTGSLLHRAREAGHTGRLCGLDPDPAMLNQARIRPGIEWVLSDAASAAWDREFDLAVMAGHAFQVLISDDEVRSALDAIRAALAEGGRFAFETRHPLARAWKAGTTPQTESGSLRFLAPDRLAAFLREAGFVIEEQFGDWSRSPLTAVSEEIITVARRY